MRRIPFPAMLLKMKKKNSKKKPQHVPMSQINHETPIAPFKTIAGCDQQNLTLAIAKKYIDKGKIFLISELPSANIGARGKAAVQARAVQAGIEAAQITRPSWARMAYRASWVGWESGAPAAYCPAYGACPAYLSAPRGFAATVRDHSCLCSGRRRRRPSWCGLSAPKASWAFPAACRRAAH